MAVWRQPLSGALSSCVVMAVALGLCRVHSATRCGLMSTNDACQWALCLTHSAQRLPLLVPVLNRLSSLSLATGLLILKPSYLLADAPRQLPLVRKNIREAPALLPRPCAACRCVIAYKFKGQRFDCGGAEGYIEATNFCYEHFYKTGKAY